MASLKEISKMCGVSVATVSKAINNRTDVSVETREQVLKAARELGYRLSARTLNSIGTNSIGVLFVDESNSGLMHDYFAGVLDSFKRTAEDKGYDITFINCSTKQPNRLTYLETCKRHGFDGVVLASIDFGSSEVLELIASDIPLVTIDHVFDNRVSVMSDNVGGMSELMEYVIMNGHRKIAYIHGSSSMVTSGRLAGFFRTAERHGITVPEDYIMEVPYRDVDATYMATESLLGLRNPPTCILFSDDFGAMGGLNAIRARGLRVPEDISVAGFDGMRSLQYLDPRLATIIQDSEKIGTVAAEKLIGLIESPRTTFVEQVIVPGKLSKGHTIYDISAHKR
ncbi:MAG: LacI family DNA-binding transcriptional regulator [Lachnospiraceae bacterium]|nr:LacI family DNA-binding transcriptional regulator [Lachnospiraceae bacterium]